jgi:hypothetical protein
MQPRRLQYQKRIKLLSGGYAKPDAFPNGEITVYPWDTHIDDWLAERARSGESSTLLFDLCAKLCDLNGCPLDLFVAGDVNTVLLVARAIRYNSVIEYGYACPSCRFEMTSQVTVPDELGRVGEKPPSYPGYDAITLPDCQDQVRIRPLQVKDEKAILNRDELVAKLMTERIMHVLMAVVSINEGRPDAWEDALRWYDALSPRDAQYLEDQENELYPHLDTGLPSVCDRCHARFKHELDVTSIDFFRPSLKSGRRASLASDVRPSLERKGANDQPEGSAGPDLGTHGPVGQRAD